MIRLSLQACAHCALCAESCFKFTQTGGDVTYTPSYKAINSIGTDLAEEGRLSDAEYEGSVSSPGTSASCACAATARSASASLPSLPRPAPPVGNAA